MHHSMSYIFNGITLFSVKHEPLIYIKCKLILIFKDVITKVLSARYFKMWHEIYYLCFDDSRQMK
jgi:hypothetical protein